MRKLTWPEIAVVTVLGSGFSPVAPATVASAVTCIFFWFVPAGLRWPWLLLAIPAFFLGVWWSGRAIHTFDVNNDTRFAHLRRPDPSQEDPGQVVIDEWVGQWITLMAAPHTVIGFVAAFVVFRFFDIGKPLGIKAVQNARAGWGIMLDDLLAGVYGAIVMAVASRVVAAWVH